MIYVLDERDATAVTQAHEEGRKTGLHQAAILLRGEAERVLKVEHLPIVERQRRSTHLRRLAATVETLK